MVCKQSTFIFSYKTIFYEIFVKEFINIDDDKNIYYITYLTCVSLLYQMCVIVWTALEKNAPILNVQQLKT